MLPIIWLLGLSGSGKTTLGSLLRLHLEGKGFDIEHIDGDAFRQRFGFQGFGPEDRTRNIDAIREYAFKANLQGKICIVTAITPYAAMREKNRALLPGYREVWVRCSLDELVRRDPKGLYARAGRGEIERMTGIADAFDEPVNADLVIDTDILSLAECYMALRNLSRNALRAATGHAEASYLKIPLPGANPATICLQ